MNWGYSGLFDMPVETEDRGQKTEDRGRKTEDRKIQPLTSGLRVLVIGLGNILLRDEGIGVHIAEELQKKDLGSNVEVIDGGTCGLDVLLSQQCPYKLVIVDAIRAGKEAGTVYRGSFRAGEENKLTQIFDQARESKISLHQIGLIEALSAAGKMDCGPEEIVIIGVEPGQVDCGLELTQPVKQRVGQILEKVLEEIKDDIHRE
jgi:hydrogenase maturation protease